jgi:hypothetical protein
VSDTEADPGARLATGTETVYVVLRKDGSGTHLWMEIDRASSGNAEQAIRAAVDKGEYDSGIFVAVPARSWQPRTVSVETVSRIVIDAE